jgi:EAL and modified HD-GYP domain-containing signal transduction protein
MSKRSYLVGRQPILNRREELVAYELLFRSAASRTADVRDSSFATASVIVNTLTGFGIEDILGNRKGFINLGLEILMDDALNILPSKVVVLELLETLQVTPHLVERCRSLKRCGFSLALDDHVYSPAYHELYGIVDIVKVDLVQTPLAVLEGMLEPLKRYQLQLLAEKVETQEEFRRCLDLGFDLFQGYYFARPSVMEKRRLDESGATLLELMRLLAEEAELGEIERAFRESPGLTYKLLLLVNSVGIGLRERITTVRHAITLLGRQQIKRWTQLALFASSDHRGIENPLLDMAAVRAGFMENMAGHHRGLKGCQDAREKAFMTGILSILNQAYDIPMEEMVAKLHLSEDISEALTVRKGAFGRLLDLAEMVERMDTGDIADRLDEMDIPADAVLESQKRAFSWRLGTA